MSYSGEHYLCDELVKTGHFRLSFDRPLFNEFCMKYDGDVDALRQKLEAEGFLGGVKTSPDEIMFAVTEKRTKDEVDRLVELCK